MGIEDAEWMESEHEQAAILVNTEPSVPEDDAVDLKAPEFEEDGGYSADVLVSNLTLDEPPREAPQLAVDLSPQEYVTERRRLSEIAARKRSMGSEEDEWLESEAAVMVEKQPTH